jgi:hypothetical protein
LQLVSVVVLIGLSALLRLGGLYSDIAVLYDRDQLWLRPIPYIEYPNEYPVGLGLLSWAISHLSSGKTAYLLSTAAILLVAGLLILVLGRRFGGARLWLFALSPALLWYGALNWDLFALCFLVAALLALRWGRDMAGGLLLALAVWTKLFPIVLVPLVIADRLLQRRWRDAALFSGAFAVISVAMNAPFAVIFRVDGVHLREGWLHFFTFNQARPQEANLWALLSWMGVRPDTATINGASEVLLLFGLLVVGSLIWFVRRHAAASVDVLLPAALLLLGWWFFINKVYSPQYSLWLIVLLALLGASTRLAVGFAIADTAWFIAILLAVAERGWADWMHASLLLPPLALREVMTLAIIARAVSCLLRLGMVAQTEHLSPVLTPGTSQSGSLHVAK